MRVFSCWPASGVRQGAGENVSRFQNSQGASSVQPNEGQNACEAASLPLKRLQRVQPGTNLCFGNRSILAGALSPHSLTPGVDEVQFQRLAFFSPPCLVVNAVRSRIVPRIGLATARAHEAK